MPKRPADSEDGGRRRGVSRRSFLKLSGATSATTAALMVRGPLASANEISAENGLEGSASWGSSRSATIMGFATRTSVLPGETIDFKIDTVSTDYSVRIHRLGWYGGDGARLLADVTPSATLPQAQPAPLTDAGTGLVDCGNWAVSASWTVPTGALSGVYYAHFVRHDPEDPGADESNYTLFVVRRNGPADILVQTSDMTTQAYNFYGDQSLYFGQSMRDPARPDLGSIGRAVKVSYNRPDDLRPGAENEFFSAEYPLLKFLERNGYDVAYCSGVDVHSDPTTLDGCQVFISSGHDEYVSGPQRAQVEAARDRGTHLIFMTGNEYFWKVRFEPSTDAAQVPDRTMVCYKETLENSKTDPTGAWTGTWRDPRFSSPPEAGRPENALTGQLFKAILPGGSPDFAIEVPAEYAGLRIWRNTAVSQLAGGQSRALAANTLGYEFDEDAYDNARPAGSIRLSSTTVPVPDYLIDYGGTYTQSTCQHNMTMYRADSGALVWGTGTVQWSYGLDDDHGTDRGTPTDPVMQQATVNVLADMGVQPSTLMAGLVAATAPAQVAAPAVSISQPPATVAIPVGSSVVVEGAAAASPGTVVAAVEYAIDDDGWRPATGTTTWSLTYLPLTIGTHTVRVRAIDDRCRPGQASVVQVEALARELPCSIFPSGFGPTQPSVPEGNPIEVGVRFRSDIDAFITGVKFFKGAGNTGTHVARVWTESGLELAQGTFENETETGWQTVPVTPVAVSAGVTYVASVFLPNGHYSASTGYFSSSFDLPPLKALGSAETGGNGVFRSGSSGFPTASFGATNYWVDVVLSADDDRVPSLLNRMPAPGLQGVTPTSSIAATFSEPIAHESMTMTLTSQTGDLVPGAVAYDAATRTATFSPTQTLQAGVTYTVTLSNVADLVGTVMPQESWSFTCAATTGIGPCTIWDTSFGPQDPSGVEDGAVEVGVKFRADRGGSVTALRYYRGVNSPANAVGHLWSMSGTLLATAVFDTPEQSGWQQVELDDPVTIDAETVYIVSYHMPTGGYVYSAGNLATPHDNPPLRALSASESDGNGVYRYGASAFPSSTSAGSNYWADVVFVPPVDDSAPVVVDRVPASGLGGVDPAAPVSAQFDGPVKDNSITMSVLVDGVSVGGSLTYDSATYTAHFTTSPALPAGATCTASVQAVDLSGNSMPVPDTWSFSTDGGGTPQTLWLSSAAPAVATTDDPAPIEVGVRFGVDADGTVVGLRFYKGAGNSGQHVGHLWSSTGTLLGSAIFTDESATGWQQAALATPVRVSAEETYIASYVAPSGGYASTGSYFATSHQRGALSAPSSAAAGGNGVYRYSGGFPTNSYNSTNYWVDVAFVPDDVPQVVSRIPEPSAENVDPASVVSLTFDRDMAPNSLPLTVRDSAGAAVAGQTAYDQPSRTLTFTPASALAVDASYTASLDSAQSTSGAAIPGPLAWSFYTASSMAYQTFWPRTRQPATAVVDDGSAVNLGLRFQTQVAGQLHGIRFFKGGPANSGPHTVHLWTSGGTLVASAVVSSQTARGWQTGSFDAPVTLAPGEYVASYHAPNGHYSADGGFFAGQPVTSGSLIAPATAAGAGNGLYSYSGQPQFPTNSWNATNYWVDVLFTESSTP
ncbi:MAG: DUF4082 domain-containing protein [Actinomycetales bacterium]